MMIAQLGVDPYLTTLIHRVKFKMWWGQGDQGIDPDLWLIQHLTQGNTQVWSNFEVNCWKKLIKEGVKEPRAEVRKVICEALITIHKLYIVG